MKKLLMSLLTVFLIVAMPLNSLAACGQAVTLLSEGAAAPCRGYLFTPDEEARLFKVSEDYKLLQIQFNTQSKALDDSKKQVVDLSGAVGLEQQKSEVWRVKAEDSTKKLIEADEGRGRRDLLFILLGVGLTIGAGFAIGAAAGAFHH